MSLLGRKLFILAQPSISVPSTLKCSSLTQPWARARFTTSAKNRSATSWAKSLFWFWEKLEASNTFSSSPRSMNQRNIRSVCNRAQSWRSERTLNNACKTFALSNCSGGIEGLPCRAYIPSKIAPMRRSTSSTVALMRRIGWSRAMSCSTLIKLMKLGSGSCCPRIRLGRKCQ